MVRASADEVAESVDFQEAVPGDIGSVEDAADFMGLDPEDSVEQINNRRRELIINAHPDTGGSQSTFLALQKAHEILIDAKASGESRDIAEDIYEEAGREREGPGFNFGRQNEEAAELAETVRLNFIQRVTGVDLNGYDSVHDAISDGVIGPQDIAETEEYIQDAFNAPDLDLTDLGNVIAYLIISGVVDLGDPDRMAETFGVFGGPGRGGEGFGVYNRRSNISRDTFGPFDR